jgi:hypothetical protein
MVSKTVFPRTLDFPTSKPVVVAPSAEQVSSDAELLPFRQLDERTGLTRQFAEARADRRHGNRAGATTLPGAAYDGYADRGESENRNKKLKTGLLADRLSDHHYFANLFRLYLHTTAYNLLVHMRRAVADPPPELAGEEVPVEAFSGRQRRGWHNRRRACDPLGEGQPCTWRTRLIKVAARVRETSRGGGTLGQLAQPEPLSMGSPTPLGDLFSRSKLRLTRGAALVSMPPADFRLWVERGDCVYCPPRRRNPPALLVPHHQRTGSPHIL